MIVEHKREYNDVIKVGTWIDKNVPELNKYKEVFDAVYFFVAMCQAKALEDYSTKDIAGLLLDGAPTIQDNKQYANEILDGFYIDCSTEPEFEMVNAELEDRLKKHFGLKSE